MDYQNTNLSNDVIITPPQDQIDLKQLWENVLVDIELNISKANFSTWFKNTHIIKIEDGVVFVNVPNEFVRDWLTNKFHNLILKTLRGFADNVRGLEYIIKKEDKKQSIESQTHTVSLGGELPLNDYYINKNDNLNPRYTFETFVVGQFNELAHAAAQAIVGQPGIAYNPLFIYGGTGHGKTHLIQAVGNQIKKLSPGKKIYYFTSEKFAIDYVNAVQSNKVPGFKDKYRQYDVLIMDDIQFLSNKEKTQEELFHLFNTLHDNNKQIVFSSDKHPNYIPSMEDRLKSRFAQGMIVDIPEPDHESRMAIIKTKANQNKFLIDNEIVDYLAKTVKGNIRDLEGALNAIICKTQLKGKTITLPEVKNLIKNSVKPKKAISTKEIVKFVADFYEIDEESIYEKTRRKEVVRPRQLIMYILREDFHISFPTIGSKLGGRDHTTVIHSCDKIKKELKTSEILSQELSQIRALLQ